MDLIERSGELAPIEAALDACAGGDGSLCLISGPAGIGKTALLDAAHELGAARDFAVLAAAGVESERGFPFGVVRQLYGRALSRPGGDSPRAAAASVFGAPKQAAEGGHVSFQVLDGLYWLAADLAQEGPLLLLVDDLQWVDAPSLRHLVYITRRLDGLGLAVVAAERSGEATQPLRDELIDLADRHLRPAPLSLEGAGEMTRRLLGDDPSPTFAATCLAQTGGLPLYLRELLRVSRERGARPDDDAVAGLESIDAEGLARHVWKRIEAVGPEAGAVAGLVAVLGERADPGRVGLLSELPAAQVAGLVEGLRGQDVLGDGDPPRFTHPVVRAAVEARLAAGRLDTWHRAAAHLLDREGIDVREIAGHLLECHPEADRWAVGRLRAAARAALSHGAPESAAALLRRALAEPPPDGDRLQVLRELARAEDAAGEPAAALGHLDDTLGLAEDPRTRAELAVAKAQILSHLNRWDEAVETLDLGLEALAGGEPLLEQQIDAELITCALSSQSARQRGFERLARYGGEAPEGPAAQAVLTALALGAMLTSEPASKAAGLAERALRVSGFRDGGLSTEAWTAAAWVLIFTDRPELAESIAERELALARREGHAREIYSVEVTLACAALRQGDIPAAVSRAQTSLSIVDPGRHESWAHGVLALALLDAGDLGGSERALEATSPEHWGEATAGSFSLFYARGLLRLAQGRLDEVAADVDELRRRSEVLYPGLRTLDDVWHIVGALLAHRRGDSAAARALAAEELAYARRAGAVSHLGETLRNAALVSPPEEGIAMLRESVALLEPSSFRLMYARSLVELGAALRRRGERTAAREPLSQGLDLAYRCGAGAVVAQAMTELRASGARPRRAPLEGAEALTPSEARIARLAAAGRTNREIAQELYVSLKTIEGTLGRAYAKLDISGRGARQALPAALGELGGGAMPR